MNGQEHTDAVRRTATGRGAAAALGATAVLIALAPTAWVALVESPVVLASLAAQLVLAVVGALLWVDPEHRRHAVLVLCASASIGLSNLNSDAFDSGYWIEVGWLSTWLAAGFLVPVLLQYPATGPLDRRLRWLTALVWLWALGLRLVVAATWDHSFAGYTGPARWFSLHPSLVANRTAEFALVALVAVTAVWFTAVCVRRWRTAAGPVRGTVRLVAGAGLLLALGVVLRTVAPYAVRFDLLDVDQVAVLEGAHNVLVAAAPLALLVAAVRAAAQRSAVLERMLGAAGDPVAVEESLRRELDDPTLRLTFTVGGQQVDTEGRPVGDAASDEETAGVGSPPGRLVRVLTTGEAGPPAVVDADAQVLLDPARLRVVLAAASVVLANTQLTVERAAHVAELQASRTRIVEAGVAQRRALERDLHDGAQQHLLTVATTLSRAGLASEPQEVRRALDEARDQLSSAMAELRRLARGIHPVALSQGGLGVALESLPRNHEGVTVRLGPGLSSGRRLDPAIESTTYFVVAECVTNARRYAGTPVTVDADCDGEELVAVVADTGPGGASIGTRGGLRGLLDRTQALGGTLVVDSPPGAGTTVRLRLPLTSGDGR